MKLIPNQERKSLPLYKSDRKMKEATSIQILKINKKKTFFYFFKFIYSIKKCNKNEIIKMMKAHVKCQW
jgi:hypothetical protein